MRLLKWGLFFFFSFLVSWIIIDTFSHDAFRTAVPAKILLYRTVPVPIYYYIGGALIIGLLMGIGVAVYIFITLQAKLLKNNRRIKKLEKKLRLRARTEPRDKEPETDDEMEDEDEEEPEDDLSADASWEDDDVSERLEE